MAKTKSSRGTKTSPPTEASSNLETPSADYIGLNFKVDKEFYREFKQLALDSDMKLNEFLRYLVELQKARKPESIDKGGIPCDLYF